MLSTLSLKRFTLHVAVFCLFAFPATAQTGTGKDKVDTYGTPIVDNQEDLGLQSVAFRLGLYQKDDPGAGFSAGNPFLDEDLTVIEPIVIVNWGLSERSALSFTGSFDWVSSASIERLNDKSKFPASQQSGASGDTYFGLDTAYRYHLNNRTRLGTHLDLSKEYDYFSIGVGGDVAWQSEDNNTNQSVAMNLYFDSVDLIRFDGSEDGSDSRTSLALTYRWAQILSGNSQAQFGSTISLQSGFLSTPYNSVFIEGGTGNTEADEVLPDSRNRFSLFGSYRHRLTRSGSAELASRLYTDDWGITGISLEPRWYQSMGEDLLLRFRYRYYDQSESDYSGRFTVAQPFMTQDADLDAFDSQTVGLRVIGYKNGQQGWDTGFDYIMRSDDLDHLIASFGYNWFF